MEGTAGIAGTIGGAANSRLADKCAENSQPMQPERNAWRDGYEQGKRESKNWIDELFTYHPPESHEQVMAYEQVRSAAKHLAHVFDLLVPRGGDKKQAIRTLREAVMWANGAIANKGNS